MRRIESSNELKNIQFNILLAFHNFCTTHNIKYSLAAGTLIGAVRHKGFIPWDDDIDVYLLRDDYNRFIKLFPEKYNENLSLVTMERDNKWHRAYGKLYDNRTVMKEPYVDIYNDLGVGIDVFPVDDVPDNHDEWLKYERKRRFLRDIHNIKNMTVSSRRSILKNIIILVGHLVMYPFSFSYLTRKLDVYCQKHNGRGYSHVYENCLGAYNSRHPWLRKDIEEVTDATFEGHTVKIMRGYDDYLTCVYGDYMKLPPLEKRVTHHCFIAYWK